MTSTQTASVKPGDLLEVTIEKIVPGGYGLGFADGMTIFTALAVAGDRLRVEVREVKGRIAFAEVHSIIEPGPSRIDPPCVYVGICGGCDFQQMTYEAQLAAKVGIIRDSLERIAKYDHAREIPIVSSPRDFEYRLRAQWHLKRDEQNLGYYRRNSRDLVAIEHCPILAPELDAELGRLRGEIDWTQFWPEKGMVDAAVGDDGAVSLNSRELDVEPRDIAISAAGETYTFSAAAFFQGNRYLVEKLIETATRGASGRKALDLYSGVGLFTLPLARAFDLVTAVEDHAPAVAYARKNADNAGLHNIKLSTQPVGKFLAEYRGSVDFALLDPPRAGTEKKTILDLIRIGPREVSYVSCEPSILARDLRRFLDGGYIVASITAIDLFPQTHHVETIARLRRA
ncbi:MAG: class I SAM-dependent RNA methyltransferase [Pyrinomonadaceae bacterium]